MYEVVNYEELEQMYMTLLQLLAKRIAVDVALIDYKD